MMTSRRTRRRARTYHERENDADALDGLDGPQRRQTGDLDGREDVTAVRAHVTQVDVVGLVLLRHEDDEHALYQLQHAPRMRRTEREHVTRYVRTLLLSKCRMLYVHQ